MGFEVDEEGEEEEEVYILEGKRVTIVSTLETKFMNLEGGE